jgi:hypothetical protein
MDLLLDSSVVFLDLELVSVRVSEIGCQSLPVSPTVQCRSSEDPILALKSFQDRVVGVCVEAEGDVVRARPTLGVNRSVVGVAEEYEDGLPNAEHSHRAVVSPTDQFQPERLAVEGDRAIEVGYPKADMVVFNIHGVLK